MLIVDSSVWIDYYSPKPSPHAVWLEHAIDRLRIGLTDMILCEVLQGARTDRGFSDTLTELTRFEVFDTGGEELAILGAGNYRHLRALGITVRTAVDCLVATFCIAHGHTLLHRDRDFNAFERHLGLRVLHPALH